MNTNEVIANRALEILGPQGDVQSHQPQQPRQHGAVDQRRLPHRRPPRHPRPREMLEELQRLHDAFAAKEKEFDGLIKMGRTHLQDAVPIRLGQEFGAYRRVLGRDLERIRGVGQHLVEVNMGATAVGTGLNADPAYIAAVVKYLAEFSEFPIKSAEDLVDATQNTDCYTEVSAALKVCMMNLSKIANDLRLMASGPRCGLGELNLPRAPARLLHHAGQGQPGDGRGGEPGRLPGHRQRPHHLPRLRGRPVRAERDGAGAGVQPAPVDQHHDQRLHRVPEVPRGGAHGERRADEGLRGQQRRASSPPSTRTSATRPRRASPGRPTCPGSRSASSSCATRCSRRSSSTPSSTRSR